MNRKKEKNSVQAQKWKKKEDRKYYWIHKKRRRRCRDGSVGEVLVYNLVIGNSLASSSNQNGEVHWETVSKHKVKGNKGRHTTSILAYIHQNQTNNNNKMQKT